MLVYQVENGGSNTDRSPLGGVIFQVSTASSMLDAIANPIIYYYGSGAVINQAGYSGDLYNYYWTSYSRGTDGKYNPNNPQWHNAYLDGYIPLRVKSIYDPCPYLYRIPSNGTWNQFNFNPGWTYGSYLGGRSWNINTLGESWFLGSGRLNPILSAFEHTGGWGFYRSSTSGGQMNGYAFLFGSNREVHLNREEYPHSYGQPVRCIEGSLR